ncbi:hypothetical protein FN846DRAFT_906594 [Sphaerosporella brunnea]|uniref:ubiquitinyl hydrolase 1 n=1 Tax=Sphaerosporella brunnea TaxID=1250544 RepID=A0A5J5EZL0_9PEZI|nr:hypothetical protein FN846DRAFT_906594 [Sphaerosporella brunnea]
MANCKPTVAEMKYLIEHIFLPPQLPQDDKGNRPVRDGRLLLLLFDASSKYYSLMEGQEKEQLYTVCKMLLSLQDIAFRNQTGLSADKLQEKMLNMKHGDVIALHVTKQNAGVILRHSGDRLLIEMFEVSPTTKEVMKTTGRLVCSYPGPVISIDLDTAQDSSFAHNFATTLERLDCETLPQAIPITQKANSKVPEIRDTADPMFVTRMIGGILRGLGDAIPSETGRIQKNIRDDVLWDSAKAPWRRSPFWLVLRVAMQTTLQRDIYKSLMVYFMAAVLEKARDMQWDNDTLAIMNMKLARRVFKAQDRLPEFVKQRVREALTNVGQYSQEQWQNIQADDGPKGEWRPKELSLRADTNLSLNNSKGYIQALLEREDTSASSASFQPSEDRRSLPTYTRIVTLPSSKELSLYDVEKWVENSLSNWLSENITRDSACEELGKLLNDYTVAAKRVYNQSPENLSIMLLTTMELWVALDKVAVKQCPLLREYSPEVPVSLLEPLLLPKKSQMVRLADVEAYIKGRKTAAHSGNQRIFSDKVRSTSFSVEYFKQSPAHQSLRERIEAQATRNRKLKTEEYAQKRNEYNNLISDAARRSCTYHYYTDRWGERRSYHSSSCEKCRLQNLASGMRIKVHEWPLPTDELKLKSAVFELLCPKSFSVWRNITYMILVDICTPDTVSFESHSPPGGNLKEYDGLSSYYGCTDGSPRIQMWSEPKSFVRAHYSTCVVSSATLDSVCVNNGLNWRPYDSVRRGWVMDNFGKANVRQMCTLMLPAGQGPYQNLQQFVNNSTHTSNQVIASQHLCSTELSLHEFEAFGELRAGHRLQWLNIARELRARALTWGNEPVGLLLMQTAWQAGPPQEFSWPRESHLEPTTAEFGQELLGNIDGLWENIKHNWRESFTAHSLIVLTSRILTCSDSEEVKARAAELMRKGRGITLEWCRQLSEKLDSSSDRQLDDHTVQTLRTRLIQVAAICRCTYDVDSHDLPLIFSSHDDVATAVECDIIICDNEPIKGSDRSSLTRSLLYRNRRISMDLEHELRRLIIGSNPSVGMDDCIGRVWSGHVRGGQWRALSSPNERWVTKQMSSPGESGGRLREVHFNLLTGQLLIDGSPMKRLPRKYVTNPTYSRTFGHKIFDVCPGKGCMPYQAKHSQNGFDVYFGLEDGQLIVRAEKGAQKFELIPHSKLSGDFPQHMVDDYAHWMDLKSEIIEFRPLETQWETSELNPWVEYKNLQMRTIGKRYLDVRSPSALMIYSVLQPLEYDHYIEATLTDEDSTLEIKLPRFNLHFFGNADQQLECLQFRSMIVDSNQNFGTLIGLQNRLVLKDKNGRADSVSRKLLIPHGKVSYGKLGSHVNVTIATDGVKQVVLHAFDIDSTLCRLVGNSSLLSRLYKIYLHALTSHCLPDKLTGRTGTEEALHDLNSAAVWSFKELKEEEQDLLSLIASLTPERVFYPSHLRVMQTVIWNDLPALSQHEDFYRTVKKIRQYSARFRFFQEDDAPSPLPVEANGEAKNQSEYLVDRAAARNAVFRLPDFGGSNFACGADRTYAARDILSSDVQDQEAKACTIARCAQRWSSSVETTSSLLQHCEAWGTVQCDPPATLGYQSSLLQASPASDWWSLYAACHGATQEKRYDIMFTLSTLVFAEHPMDMELIWTLLAAATVPRLARTAMPGKGSYDLGHKYAPDASRLKDVIEDKTVDYYSSSERSTPQYSWESDDSWNERKQSLYRENRSDQITEFKNSLVRQWVCQQPAFPSSGAYDLLKIDELKEQINAMFFGWYENMRFKQCTLEIQGCLNSQKRRICPSPTYPFSAPRPQQGRPTVLVSINEICPGSTEHLGSTTSPELAIVDNFERQKISRDDGLEDLEGLLRALSKASTIKFETQYAQDLNDSLAAYRASSADAGQGLGSLGVDKQALWAFRKGYKIQMESLFAAIKTSLTSTRADSSTQKLLESSGLWPRVTPASLLALLAATAPAKLSQPWKRILVHYGLAVARFQRATRMYNLAQSGSSQDLAKELANAGHHGWDPITYPDWLLLEIENNLLIRPIQAEIAELMINPRSGHSSVLQLNMGEGKSSVIVPIVSAALADAEKLVRVVVLKPLSTQMFRLLVQKLGGLTNRRIFYMPFNRNIEVDSSIAAQIRELYEECMATRGILLVQPEHLLSFKLMGFEKLDDPSTASASVAKQLLDTQTWLEQKARDVLDESDEILHVRYQLIYTLGKQTYLDHAPERWIIVQQLLDLVLSHATRLREEFPKGVEIHGVHPGSFPQIRILEDQAGEKLLQCLEKDIKAGRGPKTPFRLWPETTRTLALQFIFDPTMTEEECKPLFAYQGLTNPRTLLLLRGLLAHGIVLTALRDKRWRVEYGLDAARRPPTLLAVPYRAKDCPALRAEFSHPDMAITLTSLSYYYGGLTDAQMETVFAELLKSNDPGITYTSWVDATVPESIRTLKGVNIDDFEQRQTLVFPQLRHRKRVIDFYLTQVVFPRDAKEFPHKLSTSGWDLAERRRLPITGFSGTNDNRFLLPLSLTQDDVEQNRGTNAKVLSYLLKQENNCYQHLELAANEDKVDFLLKAIATQTPRIRVLLDVGAQILLQNKEVAEKLLKTMAGEIEAVVYFDDQDEIIVQRQDGTTELLLFSPFAKQMEKTFVYLDEVHTRGTDLKLPITSRAAVTLGPKLTKDKLVQACMRMRQLGHGQTVMYFAPTEVHCKVSALAAARAQSAGAGIQALDVVRWAINETCTSTKQSVPLWASQGLSYRTRQQAWQDYTHPDSARHSDGAALLEGLKEPESQTLEEMYGIIAATAASHKDEPTADDAAAAAIWKKCDEFGIRSLHSVRMQEEQEREVAQEVEEERSVERPAPAKPATHSLHPSLLRFVRTGQLSPSAFLPIESCFSKTSADAKLVHGWAESLLVTPDFTTTVTAKGALDDYLRRISWVLSGESHAVVVSPFEADTLLPAIRSSAFVRLHVYYPKATKDMAPFDAATSLSLSGGAARSCSWASRPLMCTLGLLAGQICLSDMAEYRHVCAFLALYLGHVGEGDKAHIDGEGGFVACERRREALGMLPSPFARNPVGFVKAVLNLRRKGQGFLETHVGNLLGALPLLEEDFE